MGMFDEKKVVVQPVSEPKAPETVGEIAVISASTKIEGNVKTEGHLIVNGDVLGNVSTKGNLILAGNTTGEIYCESLLVETPESHSDIIAEQNIIIKEGTTINGNIHCKNITVFGTVNGNIEAAGNIVLKSKAVVTGDITAVQLGIENGAKVNGKIAMK